MTSSSQRAAQAPDAAHPPKSADLKRRRFLFALGAGGAGAADSGQGYRETEHVRDYYATTRI